MQQDRRREKRIPGRTQFALSWQDPKGITRSITAQLVDRSPSGLGFRCEIEIPVGTTVYIQSEVGCTTGYCCVRHCTPQQGHYVFGLELDDATKKSDTKPPESLNYYELLQVSPNAQPGTIQRIYRYLAARYHPDNPETGDPERFLRLTHAYKVLSDPDKRSAYDAELRKTKDQPRPEFLGVNFLDGVEGEVNRRLAVLAVLYRRCKSNIHDARLSLLDLEAQMGFPREYLDFTTWYLRNKKYITKEDNSDFSLTVLGVDFIEGNYETLPVLRKLLDVGTPPAHSREEDGYDAPSPARSGVLTLIEHATREPVEFVEVTTSDNDIP